VGEKSNIPGSLQAATVLLIFRGLTMRPDIHPNYVDVNVTCSCGNVFATRSTYGKKDLHIEVCSACHPFYTGQQKIVDSGGQVEKFRKRFGGSK